MSVVVDTRKKYADKIREMADQVEKNEGFPTGMEVYVFMPDGKVWTVFWHEITSSYAVIVGRLTERIHDILHEWRNE